MPDPKGRTQMRLADYILNIADQVTAALEAFEKKHPAWQAGKVELTARGVLKPMELEDGTREVWIDLDEPKNEPVSDIPIAIRWRGETTP